MLTIETSWKIALADYFVSQKFIDTEARVRQAYLVSHVCPHLTNIFKAFELTPFDKVRVVILGQDPYHGAGQAMGLSFSVSEGATIPPSLRNIYKEIENDLGRPAKAAARNSGELSFWAKQGVLLLNSVLTVEAKKAGSHQSFGWQHMTDEVIKKISSEKNSVVFMLWGAYAQSNKEYIDDSKHLVLTAPHPSPLSAHRGFFGSRHFSQANLFLETQGFTGIDW